MTLSVVRFIFSNFSHMAERNEWRTNRRMSHLNAPILTNFNFMIRSNVKFVIWLRMKWFLLLLAMRVIRMFPNEFIVNGFITITMFIISILVAIQSGQIVIFNILHKKKLKKFKIEKSLFKASVSLQ